MKTVSTTTITAAIVLTLTLSACEKTKSKPTPTPLAKIAPPASVNVAQLPDDKVESITFSTLSNAIGCQYERQHEIVSTWTPGQQMLYTTWILEGEVNNGGFIQYFWNQGDKLAQTALNGFRLIGATQHADLVERAIQTYKSEAALHNDSKDEESLDAFERAAEKTELSKLDDQFYELTEDVSALRTQYMRKHPEEFNTTKEQQ